MGQMTPRGGSHSRVVGGAETVVASGIAHVSATIQMYMTTLKGGGVQKALNLIADAFAAMELERFKNSGSAPAFGINNKWYPDTDEWANWKATHGYETGVLRFTNALMQSATHPKVEPIGQKGMRLTPPPVYNKKGENYGTEHQNGETKSGITREWVTITPEFRAIALEIMEIFILPSKNEIDKARRSVRERNGIKKVDKITVHEDKRKGRKEADLRYRNKRKAIREAANAENNVKAELQSSRTVGGEGTIGRTMSVHEYASYSKASNVFGAGVSEKELVRYHTVAAEQQAKANASIAKNESTRQQAAQWTVETTAQRLGLSQEQAKTLLIQRTQAARTRSARASDGFTRP